MNTAASISNGKALLAALQTLQEAQSSIGPIVSAELSQGAGYFGASYTEYDPSFMLSTCQVGYLMSMSETIRNLYYRLYGQTALETYDRQMNAVVEEFNKVRKNHPAGVTLIRALNELQSNYGSPFDIIEDDGGENNDGEAEPEETEDDQ